MTYSEKLKDPRWQKKRLEILQRDQWRCQLCKSETKTLHVHHAKGYKNGLQPWEYPNEQLQTLCDDCHAQQHTPVNPIRFYLAGKIKKRCWRTKLIVSPFQDGRIYDEDDSGILRGVIAGVHDYGGPFFVSCDHGCYHGDNTHGAASHGCNSGVGSTCGLDDAFAACVTQIAYCDIFFAWINTKNCFGTLAEIGLAYGLKKPIFIACPETGLEDLWFCKKMASQVIHCDDPAIALQQIIHGIKNDKSWKNRYWV